MTTVIKDKDGELINIGPWDYMYEQDHEIVNQQVFEDAQIQRLTSEGKPIYEGADVQSGYIGELVMDNIRIPKLNKEGGFVFEDVKRLKFDRDGKPVMVPTNPLPEGANEDDEDIDILLDGSKILSSNYGAKRRAEYPPIADQLDDIFHNGIDGWKSSIQKIKDKYPKK